MNRTPVKQIVLFVLIALLVAACAAPVAAPAGAPAAEATAAPAAEAKGKIADEDITQLWDRLVSNDAPDAEREAYLAFVREGFDSEQTPERFVSKAILAAMFNPYFLIQQ